MLQQDYRDLLINTMLGVLPAPLECQNLVNAVRPGIWNTIVPMSAAYATAVPLIVDAADQQQWLRDLVQRLANNFTNRDEFSKVLAVIDREVSGTGSDRCDVPHASGPVDSKILVSDLNNSLQALAGLNADQAVRETVGRFRADFEATNEQIKILEKYKELHNDLHELQVRLPAIEDVLARSAVDPKARRSVGTFAVDLSWLVRSARKTIPGLPNQQREEDWINEFDACAKDMERVAQLSLSLEMAAQIPERLMLLLSESARINTQLVSVTYLLRLGGFAKTMDTIAQYVRSTSPHGVSTAERLATGSAAVNSLRARVEELVYQHNQWQDLNTQLDAAANSTEQRPEKRILRWPQFQQKLTSLCDRDREEDWSYALREALLRWMTAAAKSTPTDQDTVEIENSFAEFQRACMFRFFDVDKQLGEFCAQMTEIAAPLNMLLNVI
jgi:hypothetical protein